MSIKNFMRDIQFEEDKESMLLSKIRESKEFLQFRGIAKEGLEGTYIEEVIENSNRVFKDGGKYDSLGGNIARIPTIVSYNGAVYRVSMRSDKYYIRQDSNLNHLDMHYLYLQRIIGLDNNDNEIRNLVYQMGRTDITNYEDKKILLNMVISPHTKNTPLITKGKVDVLLYSQRYTTQKESESMRYYINRLSGVLRGSGLTLPEDLEDDHIGELDLSNNLIEEVYKLEDKLGRPIFKGLLNVGLEQLTFYTHKIYKYLEDKYGKEYVCSEDYNLRPKVSFTYNSRGMGTLIDVKISKRHISILDYEDREYILSIVKKSIVKNEGAKYTYDEYLGKFVHEGIYESGYKNGLSVDAVLGTNIKPHSNKFHKGLYLIISNVYAEHDTREEIRWETHRNLEWHTRERALLVSSRILYVYTHKGELTNKVYFKRKVKPDGRNRAKDEGYILIGDDLHQHYGQNTWLGGTQIDGARLPRRVGDYRKLYTELGDITLPLEVGLFKSINAKEFLGALYQKANNENNETLMSVMSEDLQSGVYSGTNAIRTDRIEGNLEYKAEDVYNEYFVNYPNLQTYKDALQTTGGDMWVRIHFSTGLFKVNKRGRDYFNQQLIENRGVNSSNIYQDKDFTESKIYKG